MQTNSGFIPISRLLIHDEDNYIDQLCQLPWGSIVLVFDREYLVFKGGLKGISPESRAVYRWADLDGLILREPYVNFESWVQAWPMQISACVRIKAELQDSIRKFQGVEIGLFAAKQVWARANKDDKLIINARFELGLDHANGSAV